jgi:hypothetical protein
MRPAVEVPIGFNGLVAFRTNVDAALAVSDRMASTSPLLRLSSNAAASTAALPTVAVHRDKGSGFQRLKKIAGWALGIGILIAVKGAIWGGVDNSISSQNPSSDTSPSASYAAPHTPSDNTPVAAETPSAPEPGSSSTPASSDVQPQVESDSSSIVPPAVADTATLTLSELRYCIAEDIRLTAQKSAIEDLRSNPEQYNQNVDAVNTAVADYQSRCDHRSYQVNDKQIADSQIEGQRPALEAEGRSRVI